MPRKTAFFAGVHWVLIGPGPATKARALVVLEGLHDLFLRVHHKGPMRDDGLADGARLHHEHLDIVFCVKRDRIADDDDRVMWRKALAHALVARLELLALEEIERANCVCVVRLGQRQRAACTDANRPDREVTLCVARPRVGRWSQGGGAIKGARDDIHFRVLPLPLGDLLGPEHREVGLGHLRCARKVEPDLKELGGVALVALTQRKHLGVHNARARRQPLHIALPKACCCTERVAVIDVALARDRDRLKAAMRMRRKARHRHAVVHAKAIFSREILAHMAACEGGLRRHLFITCGVRIFVMHAEEEGVERGPRRDRTRSTERDGLKCDAHGVSLGLAVRKVSGLHIKSSVAKRTASAGSC